PQAEPQAEPQAKEWSAVMEKVVRKHHEQLLQTPNVLHRLRDWGYTEQVIKDAGLGYNPKGYKLENGTWIPAGLLYPHRDIVTKEIVMVHVRQPYHDANGNRDSLAWAMQVDSLPKSKYTSIKGSKGKLTNYGYVYNDTSADIIVFAEGEKDCDNIHRAIIENDGLLKHVKAVFNSKQGVSDSLKRSGLLTEETRVVVFADNDETAGNKIKDALVRELTEYVHPFRIAVVYAPKGKDVTDFANIESHFRLADLIEDEGRSIPNIVYVNEQYMSNTSDMWAEHYLIGLDAPMGTGKTFAVGEFVQHHNYSALILTHRRSLTRNVAERLSEYGFVCQYDDDDASNGQRVVYTINSIDKLQGRQFDVVVIDEVNQVAEHLIGGTFAVTTSAENNELTGESAYGMLMALCERAKHVIYSNANLNEPAYHLLHELKEKTYKVFEHLVIINTYRKDKPSVYMYDRRDNVLNEILKNGRGEYPNLIVTDSPQQVKQLSEILRQRGYNTIAIHQNTVDTEEIIEFLRDPNALIEDYDFVIASPTITSGFSIEKPIGNVYAYNTGLAVTAETTTQQIGRARNVKGNIYVHIAKDASEYKPVSWREVAVEHYKVNEWLRKISHDNLIYLNKYRNDETVPEPSLPYWRFRCKVEAYIQNEKQRVQSSFLEQMYQDGYTDIIFVDDEDVPDAVQEIKKEVAEKVADYEKEKTLHVEPVDENQEKILRDRGLFTEDTEYGIRRSKIENAYGRVIDEDIYLHWRDICRKSTRPLVWFSQIALKPEVLKSLDNNEGEQRDRLPMHYSHYTARRHLLAGMLALLYPKSHSTGGFVITYKNTQEHAFTAKYADQLLQALQEDAELTLVVKHVFGVNPAKYKTGIQFLRALLRQFGLLIDRKAGDYCINADSLRKMTYYRYNRMKSRDMLEDCDSALAGLLVYDRRSNITKNLNKRVYAFSKESAQQEIIELSSVA
ncbi:MAG: hypothetical protein CUN55_13285, partial [Phototrophicales bacterium]